MNMDYFESSTTHLKELYEKYKDNEYMTQRIYNHIHYNLPNTLDTEYENYNERLIRTNTLHADQETFIKVFLSKHQYFYLNSTNCFYEYSSNSKYKIVREDEIQHKLLSTITEDKKLMDWKHKTKINIIKQIKERSLFKSIPNSVTIQNVLNVLCPAFFPSKTSAKYFLTIIGDNILKKNTSVKIIKKHIVEFNELEAITYMIGYNTITQNFTSKYHENHVYNMYRLLSINDNFSIDIWRSVIRQLGLDLLCVATHYSNRYENSENYINQCSDNVLKDYTLFLKINSQEQIISQFMSHSIKKVEDTAFTISWKNLHYIWKLYLSTMKLPNMIYSNSLKQILKQHIEYDDATDTFLKVTSKFLPSIGEFLLFWESHICIQTNVDVDFIEELEVNDLYELFKKVYTSTTILENDLFKLIRHFFPDIEIVENKYMLNVSCLPFLWNKNENILESLDCYKSKQTESLNIVSFDELYQNYTNYCGQNKLLITNKKYFEKYVSYKLKDFVVFETFIGGGWI
jgi:hypothetical protein